MAVDYKEWAVKKLSKNLVAQNNAWGAISTLPREAWKQGVGVQNGDAYFEYAFPVEFDTSQVIAYPEVIYGNKFGYIPSGATDLPIQVKDIKNIDVSFDFAERNNSTSVRNFAVETFFHSTKDITGPGHPSGTSNKVFELMVWVDKPDANSGIVPGKKIDTIKVDGRLYDVYVKTQNDYIAFIDQSPRNAGTFCWSDFIEAAKRYGSVRDILDRWYISAFEFGAEIWAGSGEIVFNDFTVEINKDATPTLKDGKLDYWKLASLHNQIADCYKKAAQ